ncbi:MAG: winged helix-turn-helix domain-containing protein [Chloroflexota bacterium]|nr:winged helix-turn-helix domain-containing protein [Chloroflexota bacterium]
MSTMDNTSFQPVPFQTLSEPKQLKALSDPLRARLLRILADREATNQQLAQTIGEPQAKVLHHVRVLLDAGLIRLVDQRVRGGNVEKYYRATARLFGFRPAPEDTAPLVGGVFASITQEAVASATLWPDETPCWEGRRAKIAPERLAEFEERLQSLIADYWGSPEDPIEADPDAPTMAFVTLIYRFPGDR